MENQQWEKTYQLLSLSKEWVEISADTLLILPSGVYKDTEHLFLTHAQH